MTNTEPTSGSFYEEVEVLLQTPVAKYLGHLFFVAGVTALNVILLSLLQTFSTFKVETLPQAYQGLAYLLLPALVLAGKAVQQQLATELAQEQAAKAMVATVTAQAETATANAQLADAKEALVVEKNLKNN